jgi:snRNA-activating protein complex subunit 3
METDFRQENMHETRVKDLMIVIGQPYLYRHDDNCDHIIIFHDFRLFNGKNDPLFKDVYP